MRTQKSILLSLLTVVVCMSCSTLHAAIENDPKKEYKLNSRLGPWMIMVATFSDVAPDQKKEGLTAHEAARKLVGELRGSGYPAYVYAQDSKQETIETFDRLGNKDKRKYNAQLGMVCVLACNFESIEDKRAQNSLTEIKRFRPKFLADPEKVGAIVREASTSKRGPFQSAFLTINPLRNPNDLVHHTVDNVVRSLNSGIEYPLVGVKKKYTLRIATFTGKSAVPVGNSKYTGHEDNFDKAIQDSSGPYSLARAGEDATQLTYALRSNNVDKRGLNRDRFESYVYHDRVQSIVTVGSFDSPNDPEIKRLAQSFMAGYEMRDGAYQLNCKTLSLPNRDPQSPPIQTWAFDPMPKLIEVPRIK